MPSVAVARDERAMYPSEPPFDPVGPYPELPAAPFGTEGRRNNVHGLLRSAFMLLDFDKANAGTARWNPLGRYIQPGMTVFIKPNMIGTVHPSGASDAWVWMVTHGSVIRGVVDYAAKALEYRGTIYIGDAPQTDSDFSHLCSVMGLNEIAGSYADSPDLRVVIVDLRDECWTTVEGVITKTIRLKGDPNGSMTVDLGADSWLAEKDTKGSVYYGAHYDQQETNRHHSRGRHEYALSRSPFLADVFINIPKLKTHKKCGMTVNLKSLVGINANKNWLPHYVFGSPETGGDQFPAATSRARAENMLVRFGKWLLVHDVPWMRAIARPMKRLGYRLFGDTEHVVRSGNWYGNDTVWRMCLDLNRILTHASADGVMGAARPRKYLSVVDGIVAMEGNGPIGGTRRNAGLLIVGEDPVAVDAVCAKLMGFDFKRIPLIANAFQPTRYPLTGSTVSDITVKSNVPAWNKKMEEIRLDASLRFMPHFGWVGHIEERP